MSQIRKRSLKATSWIYVGFLIGALNTYFLTHKNWFSTDQNGLTRAFIDIGQLIYAFSTLGVTSYLYKFFPYYRDNLEDKKNDLLAVALSISCIGFLLTCTGIYFLEPLIVRKFSANSLLLVEYFYWIIPMAFSILLYNVLESYSYGFEKGVLTNLLKETVLRLYTLCIIILKVMGWIGFHTFMVLFSFQFLIIVLILAFHLKSHHQLLLHFRYSKVTRKFRKKIFAILTLTFFVIIVGVLRQSMDALVLAAKKDLGKVGIFGFASYMVSVLQAPYRSIAAITIPLLARHWKEKNYTEINRIYQRSSINMLAFSLFVFFCIWLNFEQAIQVLHINPEYLQGRWVFFILGLVTIIETGTGVNGQIIATSTYWRFELWTSLLLTIMIIPLSYYLTTTMGIIGPAISNLISFSCYNLIRIFFLWKKFGMQPFSNKTIELLGIACIAYWLAIFIAPSSPSIFGIILRLSLFSLLFLPVFYWRRISPDVEPVMANLLKRVFWGKK